MRLPLIAATACALLATLPAIAQQVPMPPPPPRDTTPAPAAPDMAPPAETPPAEPAPAAPVEAAPLTIPATPVAAAPLSAEIGRDGIAATLARLTALPDPAPEDRFAIAGLEFLSGLEAVYQWRARHGIPRMGGLFLGASAELAPVESVEPFRPESFAEVMETVLAAMERSRAAVEPLAAEGADFGLAIDLDDLWFDVDANGTRDPAEGTALLWMGEVTPGGFDLDPGLLPDGPVIRFDTADAAWLAAYGHLVAGMGEFILAFDPTPAIAQATEVRARIRTALASQGPMQPNVMMFIDGYIDPFAIVLGTLRNQPDAARTRAVRAHWQATIAQNRRFWALVAAETDNAAEWIPNAQQVSATGMVFPPETGPVWAGVLDDAEALLAGTRSIPFWRAPIGLDLAAWLDKPGPLPLEGVIQGWSVLPYATEAPPVSPDSMRRFTDLLSETGPFMAMLMIN